ncbi:alpha/beta fold hydrolase [Pseudooceanicola sp. MF1-13]|uniref:alpha/beta fold hydrolase n=1 Tax=Pseudooceanicola sp. MF1-13 TaxID=3379095 RepID=UPI0038916DBA
MDGVTLPPDLTAPDPDFDALDQSARRHVTGPEGRRIHWAEWGPADATPLVLLHGAYGSWPHFIRNINAFSNDHRVLVPDIPGYGLSDLPAPLSIAAIGEAVADGLVELIGNRPYRLFGFSFGGAIGGRLMLHHRDQITHAMLAAPAGIATAKVPPMKGVRFKQGEELVQALAFNLRSIMFARDETVTPQVIALQHRVSMAARLRVERVDWGEGLRAPVTDFPGHLSVIWGAADSFVGPAEMPDRPTWIKRWNPRAATHVIDNAGHWVQYEAADQVNDLLRAHIML